MKVVKTSLESFRRFSARVGSERWASGWMAALVVAAAVLTPLVSKQASRGELDRRLTQLEQADRGAPCAAVDAGGPGWTLSPRSRRLGALLSSWETIGGCGAGGSGASSSIKWIGRNVHGGLFNVVQTVSFLHLYNNPGGTDFRSGYNFTSSTQIGKDISEKISAGVVIPMIYKYYGDVLHAEGLTPYDVSNGGLGDISLLGILKLGEINDTILTLSATLPTGEHRGEIKSVNAYLTQEKQLGFGRPGGSLTLDHVFDQIWGLIVVGGSAGYRGGRNDLGNYRAPTASLYAHTGYYMGQFVPSAGLTASGFLKHDQDQNIDQNTPLGTLAPSAAIEWSSDYVALLLGGTLPFGTSFNGKYGMLPWTVSLGLSVSPF